jgi:CheY-like chemotaxis protein
MGNMKLTEASILIVDDEPDLVEIFGHWLTAAGCRNVYRAEDGEGALAVINSTPIDLLVTDIRMPIMDGITLVRKLGERAKSFPSVIIISGFGDIDQREMYALGVEAFLAKPIRKDELIDALERALAERSSLWLTPMEVVPRQSLLIQFDRAGGTPDQDSLCLGRGGFIARITGSVNLGKVAFRCSTADEREIAGEGYVRWYSKNDQTVGIEFAFLDPTCRSWLLEQIATTNPRSFIPSLL